MPIQLEVREIWVAYGETVVVRDVSFVLERGIIGCLLGPSGCGKTTLLRAIAGFEPVSRGEILLGGRRVSAPGQNTPAEQRRVGMVFQDFALFPHLTVARNVGFGLHRASRSERAHRVAELLDLVGLRQAADRYPHELSGGMQQRVALARAMAPRPEILLLDEPFSSMDAELREQLAREVRDLLRREGVTAILVTHDQLEAFAMADQIGVIAEGSVRQWGTGFGLYHEPADRFVADFIGQGVLLAAEVVDETRIKTELGRVAGSKPHGLLPGTRAEVLIRPDDMLYDDSSPRRATVIERAFRGAEYLYQLRLASGTEVLCLVPSHHQHAIGDQIGIRLEAEHLVVFPCQESARVASAPAQRDRDQHDQNEGAQ
ncbi:ABC transporter ATP-binding protein [Thiocapsa imhoffii]|uniref:ABC transporter ATP-binding protein n=1 Tax=Thiocapsa imhoffii TaxID=382777 RepID=A0A9X0WK88_9GAMM|nr:ABC transporter ATP-binding protein [Thiocapsa imhoffii]MBK1645682.1 ABC transporter ATP-binding protein [Thiocapsa imhoffii]